MKILETEFKFKPEQEAKRLAANTELIKGLDPFVGRLVAERKRTNPISSWWMPSKYMHDLSTVEGLHRHQAEMAEFSDAELAVETMIALTEEGLPLFMAALAEEPAIGADSHTNWGEWVHWWTAQESRHGGLIVPVLNGSGRIDRERMERAKTAFLANNFTTNHRKDSIAFTVFTALQERGTQIPHTRTSKTANKRGASLFAEGLSKIAHEEGDHKDLYEAVVVEAAEQNPDAVFVSTHQLLKNGMDMPGATITDGEILPPDKLRSGRFRAFQLAAEKTGAYRYVDFLGVVRKLTKALRVDTRTDLTTPEGRIAQDELGRIDREYQESEGGRAAKIAAKREMPVFPFIKPRERVQQYYVVFDSKSLLIPEK